MTLHALKKVALAASMAAMFGSAQADVLVDLGVHGTPFLFTAGTVGAGSFVDAYTFSVPTGFSLVGSVVSSDEDLPNFGITDGIYYLVSAGTDTLINTGDDTFSPGFSFDSTTGATVNFAAGGPGNYAYVLFGTGFGELGGNYSLTSFVEATAVPEPQTYALVLAGLAAIWTCARRRAA